MAGNQKQKRKNNKPKTSPSKSSSTLSRRRMSTSQIVFIALGVLIILSMVISLVANFAV